MFLAPIMIFSGKPVRIGIPRSLFYYNFAPLYETFFREMGAEVVVSHKTNKQIIADGINASNNELCLPIKLLYGHILDLKDRVDYIFLPYIISTHKGSFICPKLIGAPDIIKANLELQLLSPDVDMNNVYSSMFSALKEMATTISANPMTIFSAYKKAVEAQKLFDDNLKKGFLFEEARSGRREASLAKPRMTIAIIGHSYVFNDEYVSSGLFRKLAKQGIAALTSDAFSDKQIYSTLQKNKRKTHWNLGDRVLASAILYSENKHIDGIIYITPFSCSSDSLVTEYMQDTRQKPFMTITVDEHSGDAGFLTRVEAFIDMIQRKRGSMRKVRA